jgi:CheY-like chemotaxis protein
MTATPDNFGPMPRALIVEDDPFVLLDMEDMLAAAGVEVKGLAVTKSAAIDLIKTNDFDIATIDYDLAGETSEEVALLLREKNIPFILVSGKTDILKNKPAFKGHPVLEKPVAEQKLAQTIKSLNYG